MYEAFYGLKEKPFQIVPNPDYLYLSPVHENALTYLEYGLMENVGFILLTGEVGTGKTTLVRRMVNQFESEKEIGVIFNTNVTADDMIGLILHAFGLEPDKSSKINNINKLYQFLVDRYAQNRPVLLIIDEAQNLSDAAIEEVRMLSNLQGDDQSLIQIMLVGQPELKDRLQRPDHSQFAQRIAVNFFLSRLTAQETENYIRHRLKKAGGRPDTFSPSAIKAIFQASGGVPRTINLLCDASLVYGFGYELEAVDVPVVEQVLQDKDGLGLAQGAEGPKNSPPADDHPPQETIWKRFMSHEKRLASLSGRLDDMAALVSKLAKSERENQARREHGLKALLDQERCQNRKLLLAYGRLKQKYDDLKKQAASKKAVSTSEDSDVILLTREWRRSED